MKTIRKELKSLYGNNYQEVLGIIMNSFADGLSEDKMISSVESDTSSIPTVGPSSVDLIVAIIF